MKRSHANQRKENNIGKRGANGEPKLSVCAGRYEIYSLLKTYVIQEAKQGVRDILNSLS